MQGVVQAEGVVTIRARGTKIGTRVWKSARKTVIRRFMSSGHMKAMRFAAWTAWLDDDDSNKVEYGSQRVEVSYFIFLMYGVLLGY